MQNVVAILVTLSAVLAGAWWVSYSRLAGARHDVARSWDDVDAELRRRHVLVPELIEAIGPVAVDDGELLAELSHRITDAVAAPRTAGSANDVEPPLVDDLRLVIGLRSRYRTLSSEPDLLELHRQLASVEDRIESSRRYYNSRVERLNRRIDTFPSAVVASRHAFERAELFDA